MTIFINKSPDIAYSFGDQTFLFLGNDTEVIAEVSQIDREENLNIILTPGQLQTYEIPNDYSLSAKKSVEWLLYQGYTPVLFDSDLAFIPPISGQLIVNPETPLTRCSQLVEKLGRQLSAKSSVPYSDQDSLTHLVQAEKELRKKALEGAIKHLKKAHEQSPEETSIEATYALGLLTIGKYAATYYHFHQTALKDQARREAERNERLKQEYIRQERVRMERDLHNVYYLPGFFGRDKWVHYFGDVGLEPPLPIEIMDIMNSPCPFWGKKKKVYQTHKLCLVPQTINGVPLTIDKLGELIQHPMKGYATRYQFYTPKEENWHASTPAGPSHWVLLTTNIVPGTKNMTFPRLKKRTETWSGGYVLPKALDVLVCILMEYAETGNKIYNHEGLSTSVYCQEVVNEGQETERVVQVSGLGKEGLSVVLGHPLFYEDSKGMGAARIF